MDAQITMKQIGSGVLMSCGARDFVAGADFLAFRVGPSSKVCKVVIKLDENDTYRIAYVAMKKRGYEITHQEEAVGVYGDRLAIVVRQLGDRSDY